jgi:hypothetical protein
MPGEKRTWVIDVCRTCGELATYPFCEHREQPPPPGYFSWCAPITVRGTWHPVQVKP